jgi:hypothetical protein
MTAGTFLLGVVLTQGIMTDVRGSSASESQLCLPLHANSWRIFG